MFIMGTLAEDVRQAALRGDAVAAVGELYDRIGAEIGRRRPVCAISGRCCRFEEWGHRLYVTTLELAAFSALGPTTAPAGWSGAGCPFQAGKLCGVHDRRPMGCRLFFCDATATRWQQECYERFHGELKQLHAKFDVPYHYMEWRAALASL
jgi:Fe-S-cluster containining protein